MAAARAFGLAIGVLGAASVFGGCSSVLPRNNAGIEVFEESTAGAVSSGAKYAGWVIGFPVTLAMVPFGAIACATPWVGLDEAVDGVTAPSIGLGYALGAVIGAPVYAATFWLDDEGERPARWDSQVWVPPGFVTAHLPAGGQPRPAEPVAKDDYAVPPGAVDRLSERIDVALERGRAAIPIDAGGPATLEISLSDEPGPRPLVLMTPPSEANFAARWLADRYVRLGCHAVVVIREEEVFLEPALDAPAIEAKLRAAVIAARTVAQTFARRPDVEGIRYLGISAGGIFGSVLMAVEPLVATGVLIYPGGDLPSLIATSEESSVKAYRESWGRRGVPAEALGAAFGASVRTDPIRLAKHIDPKRVLIFLSADDSSVPFPGGDALRRAMGEPETYVLAGDHETSGICFGFVLRRADRFLLAGR